MHKILEVPTLKSGNGKELRKFHDTMQQHIRALKTMGHEPSGSFLTSLLELKLDVDTSFEWQKLSQSTSGIPPYKDLLKFIDLRAIASEISPHDFGRNQGLSQSNHSTHLSLTSVRSNVLSARINTLSTSVLNSKHFLTTRSSRPYVKIICA